MTTPTDQHRDAAHRPFGPWTISRAEAERWGIRIAPPSAPPKGEP